MGTSPFRSKRGMTWFDALALANALVWLGLVVFAVVRMGALPDRLTYTEAAKAQDRAAVESAHWTYVELALAGLVCSVVFGVAAWRRARRWDCARAAAEGPRADLAAALGLVEERAQTLPWCARPQIGERAGLECSLVAAEELDQFLKLVSVRLRDFVREWDREFEKGQPTTGQSFLEMAERAYRDMQQGYHRSGITRGIWGVVGGLREHLQAADALLVDFYQQVCVVLRTRGVTAGGQNEAAEAARQLHGRADQVQRELGKWREHARAQVQSLQAQVLPAGG